MTNAPSGAEKPDDGFARLAFGLLVSGLGVTATKKILSVGREWVQRGHNGILFETPDQSANLIVGAAGVDFTVNPVGTHSLTHEIADSVLGDLAANEAPGQPKHYPQN